MTLEEKEKLKEKEVEADVRRKEKVYVTEREADQRYKKTFSNDPFPDIQPALLNSADIYNYVIETGMIFPFYPEKLAGASYEVAIGEKIVWWDEKKQKVKEVDISRPGAFFKLKPNSIAFVMLEPTFRIPDYMALRFNLKIMHVYKGLLLGTGPLVDPGFVGKLSIPLHNLTANTYTFKHGDSLIEVEFTKLSSNSAWHKEHTCAVREDTLYKRKWIKSNRTIYDYIERALNGSNDVMVKSSIPKDLKKIKNIANITHKDMVETKKELDQKIRNIQVITILSIIPVLVFACTAIYQLGSANTVKKEQIYKLEQQCDELQLHYEELKKKYESVEITSKGINEEKYDAKN